MSRGTVVLILFVISLTVPYMLISGRVEPEPITLGIGVIGYLFVGYFVYMLMADRSDPDAMERRFTAAGIAVVGLVLIVIGAALGLTLIPDADGDDTQVAYMSVIFPGAGGLYLLFVAWLALTGRKIPGA